jgi:hypothetical protein
LPAAASCLQYSEYALLKVSVEEGKWWGIRNMDWLDNEVKKNGSEHKTTEK